ncbi:MAG: hypothetical protein OHK93_004970 [Ramalina farinacea]|uniref:Uncharacterized protein n=1 Tax=Ramalina farinacea TaxID=258253 RepID=A0AA43QVG8_9LECA|nr:hypothetical protein [Ramalina farinacea]
MHPSLSTSYIIPAVLLNPILFLHSMNALLSRILPPMIVDSPNQPPPYYPLGPSAQHPHLDIHASDGLCWSYTMVMVCAQLLAFGKVSMIREDRRKKASRRRERPPLSRAHSEKEAVFANGNGLPKVSKNDLLMSKVAAAVAEQDANNYNLSRVDVSDQHSSSGSSDSETIL